MASHCEHCARPLPKSLGKKPRRFCGPACQRSAWRGRPPIHTQTIAGPWPLPCFACGGQMFITRTISDGQTTNRFWCPCGFDESFTRAFDPDDIEPFPRPVLVLEIPVKDAEYWQARAELLEAKLNEVLGALGVS